MRQIAPEVYDEHLFTLESKVLELIEIKEREKITKQIKQNLNEEELDGDLFDEDGADR